MSPTPSIGRRWLPLGLLCWTFFGCATRQPPLSSLQTGLAAIAQSPYPPTSFEEKQEMRAAWVVSWRIMTSSKTIDEVLDNAVNARLNTLIVQVRASADSYYKSSLVPRAEALTSTDFDPLAYVLEKGHARGLKIHAWLNLGVVWRSSVTAPSDPRHIFNQHADWVLQDAKGKKAFPDMYDAKPGNVEEHYWGDWANLDLREHLVQVVQEVADHYPVDGIHLDFVRYPGRSGPQTAGHGYNLDSVRRFRQETGAEPLEHSKAWDEWRTAQVSATLGDIRQALRSRHPGVPLSAAVLGAWDLAYGRAWTDYRKALELGNLDFVFLMSYYMDPNWVWKSILNAKEVADSRKIIVGLGPYMKGNTPEKIAQQIEIGRREGVGGFCLFSLDKTSIPTMENYLAQLRHLAIHDVADNRYSLRDPLWQRLGVIDDRHRKWKIRFYSRNGRTKLVVYQRGLKSMRLAINGAKLPVIGWKNLEYIQLDLEPYLRPFARDAAANHDFSLEVSAEGATGARAEIFAEDYYAAP